MVTVYEKGYTLEPAKEPGREEPRRVPKAKLSLSSGSVQVLVLMLDNSQGVLQAWGVHQGFDVQRFYWGFITEACLMIDCPCG